ncbi:hypothetical protein C0Q70_15784 [Pomacea canaliculata]|uniref:Uncharacterized protein n=1 Tax=Pomacea canaliculata TaxID=400727 RepID=A0A2T7NVV4_POMCA|nr:hypothetical protein C0Q70_15784 [Pomacea canaliculata]
MALITVLIHQRTAAINCLGAGLTCQLAVQSNGSLFQMHNKWRLCSRKGPDRKNELLPHGCNFLSNCGSCAWDVGCVEGDTIYTVRCLARKPLLRRIATWNACERVYACECVDTHAQRRRREEDLRVLPRKG